MLIGPYYCTAVVYDMIWKCIYTLNLIKKNDKERTSETNVACIVRFGIQTISWQIGFVCNSKRKGDKSSYFGNLYQFVSFQLHVQ